MALLSGMQMCWAVQELVTPAVMKIVVAELVKRGCQDGQFDPDVIEAVVQARPNVLLLRLIFVACMDDSSVGCTRSRAD